MGHSPPFHSCSLPYPYRASIVWNSEPTEVSRLTTMNNQKYVCVAVHLVISVLYCVPESLGDSYRLNRWVQAWLWWFCREGLVCHMLQSSSAIMRSHNSGEVFKCEVPLTHNYSHSWLGHVVKSQTCHLAYDDNHVIHTNTRDTEVFRGPWWPTAELSELHEVTHKPTSWSEKIWKQV